MNASGSKQFKEDVADSSQLKINAAANQGFGSASVSCGSGSGWGSGSGYHPGLNFLQKIYTFFTYGTARDA